MTSIISKFFTEELKTAINEEGQEEYGCDYHYNDKDDILGQERIGTLLAVIVLTVQLSHAFGVLVTIVPFEFVPTQAYLLISAVSLTATSTCPRALGISAT